MRAFDFEEKEPESQICSFLEFNMSKRINITAAAFLAASLNPAFAGSYYGGVSYLDAEFSDLESSGYTLTVGRNVDYFGVVSGVQLTYADFGDDNFIDDDDEDNTLLNAEMTSTEIAVVLSTEYGPIKPFLTLGYEMARVKITAPGVAISDTQDDDGFFHSVGFDYPVDDKFGIRFEMTRGEFTTEADDDEPSKDLPVDSIRLGLVRQF